MSAVECDRLDVMLRGTDEDVDCSHQGGGDVDADPPKALAIGADQSGRWLEVIWLRFGDRDVVIHAMSLRKVFHEFLERGDW